MPEAPELPKISVVPVTLPDPPPAAPVEIAPDVPSVGRGPDLSAKPGTPQGSAYRAGVDANPISADKAPTPPSTAAPAEAPAPPETAEPAGEAVSTEERFREGVALRISLPPKGMFPAAFDARAKGPLVNPRLRADGIPGPSNYNPTDWYWLAADGRLYGSARQDFVEDPVTDEAYLAWKSAGNVPSAWPKDEDSVQSDAALEAVLSAYGLDMDPPDLNQVKADCKAEINKQAEHQRILYATPGDLMVMTYVEKVAQARAAVGDPNATPEKYPMLAASIGIDGADLLEVAETVIDANLTWMNLNAAIEGERKICNAEIDAAPDAATAQSVTPTWPAP